jgi:exodeoxyribonuclease V
LNRPVAGDEIMILRNDKDLQLFNGSTLRLANVEGGWKKDTLAVVTDEGRELLIDTRGFTGEQGLKQATEARRKGVAVASFCEALTVHKAQGSEWDNVLIAEDISRVGARDDRVRWRYTAVTRARKQLHVVGGGFLKPVK